MISRKILSIQSEIDELEKILSSIPQEAAIERFAFEKRLQKAQQELNSLDTASATPETLRLTFRGAPVVGNKGIQADFAGKASTAFSDAFSAILAGINSTLNYMGPIPDKAKHPLLITGTAVGSFGFEIELPTNNDLFGEYSRADEAIESFRELLRVSAEGSDDDIADIVQEIHPRAVRKVADFLDLLHRHNAWCGLEFREQYFKYSNIDQLIVSEDRLREGNIDEREEAYFGEFQGVLPQGRTFEFKIADGGSILRGKVDDGIEDPDVLNREFLHKPRNVTFDVVQVGQGRPRFTLKSLEKISAPEHEG